MTQEEQQRLADLEEQAQEEKDSAESQEWMDNFSAKTERNRKKQQYTPLEQYLNAHSDYDKKEALQIDLLNENTRYAKEVAQNSYEWNQLAARRKHTTTLQRDINQEALYSGSASYLPDNVRQAMYATGNWANYHKGVLNKWKADTATLDAYNQNANAYNQAIDKINLAQQHKMRELGIRRSYFEEETENAYNRMNNIIKGNQELSKSIYDDMNNKLAQFGVSLEGVDYKNWHTSHWGSFGRGVVESFDELIGGIPALFGGPKFLSKPIESILEFFGVMDENAEYIDPYKSKVYNSFIDDYASFDSITKSLIASAGYTVGLIATTLATLGAGTAARAGVLGAKAAKNTVSGIKSGKELKGAFTKLKSEVKELNEKARQFQQAGELSKAQTASWLATTFGKIGQVTEKVGTNIMYQSPFRVGGRISDIASQRLALEGKEYTGIGDLTAHDVAMGTVSMAADAVPIPVALLGGGLIRKASNALLKSGRKGIGYGTQALGMGTIGLATEGVTEAISTISELAGTYNVDFSDVLSTLVSDDPKDAEMKFAIQQALTIGALMGGPMAGAGSAIEMHSEIKKGIQEQKLIREGFNPVARSHEGQQHIKSFSSRVDGMNVSNGVKKAAKDTHRSLTDEGVTIHNIIDDSEKSSNVDEKLTPEQKQANRETVNTARSEQVKKQKALEATIAAIAENNDEATAIQKLKQLENLVRSGNSEEVTNSEGKTTSNYRKGASKRSSSLMAEIEAEGLIDNKTRDSILKELDDSSNEAYEAKAEEAKEADTKQEETTNETTNNGETKAQLSDDVKQNMQTRQNNKFRQKNFKKDNQQSKQPEKKPVSKPNDKTPLTKEEKDTLNSILDKANTKFKQELESGNTKNADKFWVNALNKVAGENGKKLTRKDAKKAFVEMISQSGKGLPRNFTINGLKQYLYDTGFFGDKKLTNEQIKFIREFITVADIASMLDSSSIQKFQDIYGIIQNINDEIQELSEKVSKEPNANTDLEQNAIKRKIYGLTKRFNNMVNHLSKLQTQLDEMKDAKADIREAQQDLINEYRTNLNYIAKQIYLATSQIKSIVGATKSLEKYQERVDALSTNRFVAFFKRLVGDFANILSKFIDNIANIADKKDRMDAIKNMQSTFSNIAVATKHINNLLEGYFNNVIIPNYYPGPAHPNTGIELNRSSYIILSIHDHFLTKYGDTDIHNFTNSMAEMINADLTQLLDEQEQAQEKPYAYNKKEISDGVKQENWKIKTRTSYMRVLSNLKTLFGDKISIEQLQEKLKGMDSKQRIDSIKKMIEEDETLQDLHDIIKLYTLAFFQSFNANRSKSKGVKLEGHNVYDITNLEEYVFDNFCEITGMKKDGFNSYMKASLLSITLNYLQYKNKDPNLAIKTDPRISVIPASKKAINWANRIFKAIKDINSEHNNINIEEKNNILASIGFNPKLDTKKKEEKYDFIQKSMSNIYKSLKENKDLIPMAEIQQMVRDIEGLITTKETKENTYTRMGTYIAIPNNIIDNYAPLAESANFDREQKKKGRNTEKSSLRTTPKRRKPITEHSTEKEKRDNIKFEISEVDRHFTKEQLELDELFVDDSSIITKEEYNALMSTIEEYGVDFTDLSSVLYYIPVYEYQPKYEGSDEIVRVLNGYKPLNFNSEKIKNKDKILTMLSLKENMELQDIAEFAQSSGWMKGLIGKTKDKMANIGEMISAIRFSEMFKDGFYFDHDNMSNNRLKVNNTMFNTQSNKFMRHLVVAKEYWDGTKYSGDGNISVVNMNDIGKNKHLKGKYKTAYDSIRFSLAISIAEGYEKEISVDSNGIWKYNINNIDDIVNMVLDSNRKQEAIDYLSQRIEDLSKYNDLTAEDQYLYQNMIVLKNAVETGILNWRDLKIEVDGKSTGIFEATMHLNSNSQSIQEALRIQKYVIVGNEVYSIALNRLNDAKKSMKDSKDMNSVLKALRLDEPYGTAVARMYNSLTQLPKIRNLKISILNGFFKFSGNLDAPKMFKKLRDLGKKFVIAPNYGQGLEQIALSRNNDSLHYFLFNELAKEVSNEFRRILSNNEIKSYKELIDKFISENLNNKQSSEVLQIIADMIRNNPKNPSNRVIQRALDLNNAEHTINSNPFFDTLLNVIFENEAHNNVFNTFANSLNAKVFFVMDEVSKGSNNQVELRNDIAQGKFTSRLSYIKRYFEELFDTKTSFGKLNISILDENSISNLLDEKQEEALIYDIQESFEKKYGKDRGIELYNEIFDGSSKKIKQIIGYLRALNSIQKIKGTFDIDSGFLYDSLWGISETSKVRKTAGDYKRAIMKEGIQGLAQSTIEKYQKLMGKDFNINDINLLDEITKKIEGYLTEDFVETYGANRKFSINLSKSENGPDEQLSTRSFIEKALPLLDLKREISSTIKEYGKNYFSGVSTVLPISTEIASLVVTLLEHPVESSVGNQAFVDPSFPVHSAIFDGFIFSIGKLTEGAEGWTEGFKHEKAINPMFNLVNVMQLTRKGTENFINKYRKENGLDPISIGKNKNTVDKFLFVSQYVDFATLVNNNNIAVEGVKAYETNQGKEISFSDGSKGRIFTRTIEEVEDSPAFKMYFDYIKDIFSLELTNNQKRFIMNTMPAHIIFQFAGAKYAKEVEALKNYLNGAEYLSEKVIIVKDKKEDGNDNNHPLYNEYGVNGKVVNEGTDEARHIARHNTANIVENDGKTRFETYPLDSVVEKLLNDNLTDSDIEAVILDLHSIIHSGKDLYLRENILSPNLLAKLNEESAKINLKDFYNIFNAAMYLKPNIDGIVDSMAQNGKITKNENLTKETSEELASFFTLDNDSSPKEHILAGTAKSTPQQQQQVRQVQRQSNKQHEVYNTRLKNSLDNDTLLRLEDSGVKFNRVNSNSVVEKDKAMTDVSTISVGLRQVNSQTSGTANNMSRAEENGKKWVLYNVNNNGDMSQMPNHSSDFSYNENDIVFLSGSMKSGNTIVQNITPNQYLNGILKNPNIKVVIGDATGTDSVLIKKLLEARNGDMSNVTIYYSSTKNAVPQQPKVVNPVYQQNQNTGQKTLEVHSKSNDNQGQLLTNVYRGTPFVYGGNEYKSVEHAYQSLKGVQSLEEAKNNKEPNGFNKVAYNEGNIDPKQATQFQTFSTQARKAVKANQNINFELMVDLIQTALLNDSVRLGFIKRNNYFEGVEFTHNLSADKHWREYFPKALRQAIDNIKNDTNGVQQDTKTDKTIDSMMEDSSSSVKAQLSQDSTTQFDSSYNLQDHIESLEAHSFALNESEIRSNIREFIDSQEGVDNNTKQMQKDLFDTSLQNLPQGTKVLIVEDQYMPNNVNGLFGVANGKPYVLIKESAYQEYGTSTLAHEILHASTELAARMKTSIGANNLVSKIQRLHSAATEILKNMSLEALQAIGLADENGVNATLQAIMEDYSEFIAYFGSEGKKLAMLKQLQDKDIIAITKGVATTKLGKLVELIKSILKAATNIITGNRMFYERNNNAAENFITYIEKLSEYNDPTRANTLDHTTYNRLCDLSNKAVSNLWSKVPYLNSLIAVDAYAKMKGYTQQDIDRVTKEIREEFDNSPVFDSDKGKLMNFVRLFRVLRPMYYKSPLHREVALAMLNETLIAHSNIITDEIRAILRDFRIIGSDNLAEVEKLVGRLQSVNAWKNNAKNNFAVELDKMREEAFSDEIREKINKMEEEFVAPSQTEIDDDIKGIIHLTPKEKLDKAEGVIMDTGILYIPQSKWTNEHREEMLEKNLNLLLFDEDGSATGAEIERQKEGLKLSLVNLINSFGNKVNKDSITDELITYFMSQAETLGEQRLMGGFDAQGLQNLSQIIDSLGEYGKDKSEVKARKALNDGTSFLQLHKFLLDNMPNRQDVNKKNKRNYEDYKSFIAQLQNIASLNAIKYQKDIATFKEAEQLSPSQYITATRNEELMKFMRETYELEDGNLSQGFVTLMGNFASNYTALSNAAKLKTNFDGGYAERIVKLDMQLDELLKEPQKNAEEIQSIRNEIQSLKDEAEFLQSQFGGARFDIDYSFDNFSSYQFNPNISQKSLRYFMPDEGISEENIANYYRGVTNNPNITTYDAALEYLMGLGYRVTDKFGKAYDVNESQKGKWDRFTDVSSIKETVLLTYEGIDANNNDITQTYAFLGNTTDVKGEKLSNMLMSSEARVDIENNAKKARIRALNNVGKTKGRADTIRALERGYENFTPVRGSKGTFRTMPNRLQFENQTKVDTSIKSRLLKLNELVYNRKEEETVNFDFVKSILKDTIKLNESKNKALKNGFVKVFDYDFTEGTASDATKIGMSDLQHRLPENINKLMRSIVKAHNAQVKARNEAYGTNEAEITELYLNKDVAQVMLGMRKETLANIVARHTTNPKVIKWLNKFGYRFNDVLNDMKSNIVVRNPQILFQNVLSNQLSLLSTGMSIEQIAQTSEAVESDLKIFLADMAKMYELQLELGATKNALGDRETIKVESDKIQAEIDALQKKLENNRVYYPMVNGVDSNIEDETRTDKTFVSGVYRKGIDFLFDKLSIEKLLRKHGIDIEYAKNMAAYTTDSELFKHSVLFNRTGDIVPKIVAYEKYLEEGYDKEIALRRAKTMLIDYNMPLESSVFRLFEGLGLTSFMRFSVRVIPALLQNLGDKPVNTLMTMVSTGFLHSVSPYGLVPASIFNEAEGAIDKLSSPFRTVQNGENLFRWGWMF